MHSSIDPEPRRNDLVVPPTATHNTVGSRRLNPSIGIGHVVVERALLEHLAAADGATQALLAARIHDTLDRCAMEWSHAHLLVASSRETPAAKKAAHLLPALHFAPWFDPATELGLERVGGRAKRDTLAVFGTIALATSNKALAEVVQRAATKAPGLEHDKSTLETLKDYGGRTLALSARDFAADLFETTDPGIVCSGFPKLHLTVGCPYRCLYCYMLADEQMFRVPTFTRAFLNIADAGSALQRLDKKLRRQSRKLRVNMGELGDTLAFEPVLQLLPPLFDVLKGLPNIELALVSKSANACPPVPPEALGRVFHYASVSCEPHFEGKTAPPMDRLDALAKSRANGAVTCVRLDPLGPAVVESRDAGLLRELVAKMVESAQPELVILGTPRFAHRLVNISHRGVGRYVDRVEQAAGARVGEWDKSESKVRPAEALRIRTYRAVIELIRAAAARLGTRCPQLWVCKEAPSVLAALGMPDAACCYTPPPRSG